MHRPHLRQACRRERTLPDKISDTHNTAFSHVRPGDTPFHRDGLRDFFLCRDLGVAAGTGGKVLAQRVIAHNALEEGTGWHRHEAD